MDSELNTSLAMQVRQLLHPTGRGGSMGQHYVNCTGNACVATFTVEWEGGVFGAAYQTTVQWIVPGDGTGSFAGVRSESSVIGADRSHTESMERFLQGVAARLR